MVRHAGAALLRELADRLGLTTALGWRQAGGRRRHPDAAVLRGLAVMLVDGGDCLSDLAALDDQPELFGPVASTPTAWRVVDRLAQDAEGLARLRAARAHARGRAWAVGAPSEPELLIVDADATLVTADSDPKQGAAGTYKHSFGFHLLLAYLDRALPPAQQRQHSRSPHRPRTPPTPCPQPPRQAPTTPHRGSRPAAAGPTVPNQLKWDPAVPPSPRRPRVDGVETTAGLVRTDRGRRLERSMEVTEYEPINRWNRLRSPSAHGSWVPWPYRPQQQAGH